MEYFTNVIAVSFLIVIVLAVVTAIGYWKVFVKMGEAGWKGLIPIYNNYLLFKDCWEAKYFLVWIGAAIITGGLSSASDSSTLISTIVSITGLAVTILNIALNYHIAKAFGYGVGFTIGLTIIPTVFYIILGFSSDQYLGNPAQETYNSYDDYNQFNDRY